MIRQNYLQLCNVYTKEPIDPNNETFHDIYNLLSNNPYCLKSSLLLRSFNNKDFVNIIILFSSSKNIKALMYFIFITLRVIAFIWVVSVMQLHCKVVRYIKRVMQAKSI